MQKNNLKKMWPSRVRGFFGRNTSRPDPILAFQGTVFGRECTKFRILFHLSRFAILLYCLSPLAGRSLAQDEFVYQDGQRRDPFVPLVSADGKLLVFNKETEQQIQVNGIIYDRQAGSYAIVNSTVVREGDLVGDCRVLRIERDKVVFDKKGLPLEIELDEEIAE